MCGATRRDPLRVDVEAPEKPEGPPLAEVALQAGSMLYVSRGWWHAVAATQRRSLHLTCGLPPATGHHLLVWLAGQLLHSPTLHANVPTVASPAERTAYAEQLRKEVAEALHANVVSEFTASMNARDPGRPAPSLPHIDDVPADPGLVLALTTARAGLEGADEAVVLRAAEHEWELHPSVRPALEALVSGARLTFGNLAERSGLTGNRSRPSLPSWYPRTRPPSPTGGTRLFEAPPPPPSTGCWPPSSTPPTSSACAPAAAGCGGSRAEPSPRPPARPGSAWSAPRPAPRAASCGTAGPPLAPSPPRYRAPTCSASGTGPPTATPTGPSSTPSPPTRWSPRAPSSTRTRACPRRGGRRWSPPWTASPTSRRRRTARPCTRSTCAASSPHSPATRPSPPLLGAPPTATLHYINRSPHILDWEGWGRAPYGYGAATLYLYALLTPEAAARIRTPAFPVLDRPEARTGMLTVCAQVLQAQDRVDVYAELAGPVREHLAELKPCPSTPTRSRRSPAARRPPPAARRGRRARVTAPSHRGLALARAQPPSVRLSAGLSGFGASGGCSSRTGPGCVPGAAFRRAAGRDVAVRRGWR
ncbi:JmjC domain-containing protein [Streptomyces goshikiensis]|uniref:JmjC domain-containing protein n=1 Tax=Streptomyces goshikiensis TaxID=1942 RepID=UPI0039941D39